VLTSQRTLALGWRMAFLDPTELSCFHIDRDGSSAYRAWKQQAATAEWATMQQVRKEWCSGHRRAYVPLQPDEDDGFEEVTRHR
jgi:hypothetical protein